MEKENKTKVLVFLIGSLGDSIVAIPALRAIRRRFADSEIVLLQNLPLRNLVQASEVIPKGLVDRSIDYYSDQGKKGGFRDLFRLSLQLRSERFDAVAYLVVSERTRKSVIRDRLFFRLSGIPHLLGFHSYPKELLYPRDAKGRPAETDGEAVRKLKRLETDGISWNEDQDLRIPLMSFTENELKETDRWLEPRRRRPNSRLIAIAPGTKKPACAWPISNFIELGRRIIQEYDCELIVVGGENEQKIGKEIISAWKQGINAAGAISVHQAGALLSRCDMYVGVDTGTTHLAAAVGTPWFAVFHQRDNPGQWYPMGQGCLVTSDPLPCAGCRMTVCPIPEHPCMKGITVDAAWGDLRSFASKTLRGRTVRTTDFENNRAYDDESLFPDGLR